MDWITNEIAIGNYLEALDVELQAPPVLVQCHAGRSRSAVVMAGYLVAVRGINPEAALHFVAEKRQIAVTAGLERLLDSL